MAEDAGEVLRASRANLRPPPSPASSAVSLFQLRRLESVGVTQVRREALAHQVDEIVAVETIDGARGQADQRIAEPLQGIATAFNMREVGGEETHFLAR